jgi:hypothetical protein
MFTAMVAPLEHRDTEPLESIIASLKEQIEREKEFQESLLWKIRLLERELQYCQHQVNSFTELLEVPRRIVALEKEDRALDETLLSQRAHLRAALSACEDEELRKISEGLLSDLDRELDQNQGLDRQEAITRILQGYVDTGMRYREQCQSRIAELSHRIEQLENELALSRHEEQQEFRMCELAIRFCSDHPGATYGDFRGYVMRLLGIEMERELKSAIQRISPAP